LAGFATRRERGIGAGSLVLLILLLIGLIVLGFKVFSHQAPGIKLAGQLKGIGQSTELRFAVSDPQHRIKSVSVEVQQDGKSFHPAIKVERKTASAGAAWWKFWRLRAASRWMVTARIGRNGIPDLKPGQATLLIAATNDSWGRLFRGGRSEVSSALPVRFIPPQVDVLTPQNYVAQGGCDLVIFKVSPGTVSSGVKVGEYFFPSWPVKPSEPDTRLCLFAFPYDLDPATPAHIIARDDAGNETVASFSYKVLPKKFHASTIQLRDAFINRVVPAIMSHTPDLENRGSLLKNFLEINGHLRRIDDQLLVAYSRKTADHFLWTEPFLRLAHSATEASFADRRTYVYDGQVVDHQTHLGFDLASVEHAAIDAANDGVVVHAGYFGIYGNAVIIDHGCGLQTLYGHMTQIAVKEGEAVKRNQLIGHSGETGLAGGDHLHFSVVLDGLPVNPAEWWDPHWVRDRIESKLAPYR
jgi:Peptidase family M23